jgi:hypothetical protein
VKPTARRVLAPGRIGALALLAALLSVARFAVLVSPANAKPEYLDAFNKKYDKRGSRLDTCNTCHTTAQDAEHRNPYGVDFGNHNHDFGAIEQLDSDGDGVKNIDEIKADTFPGDKDDYPGHPKPKPKPPTTTTTTRPFPFSLLPQSVPNVSASGLAHLLAILEGRSQ